MVRDAHVYEHATGIDSSHRISSHEKDTFARSSQRSARSQRQARTPPRKGPIPGPTVLEHARAVDRAKIAYEAALRESSDREKQLLKARAAAKTDDHAPIRSGTQINAHNRSHHSQQILRPQEQAQQLVTQSAANIDASAISFIRGTSRNFEGVSTNGSSGVKIPVGGADTELLEMEKEIKAQHARAVQEKREEAARRYTAQTTMEKNRVKSYVIDKMKPQNEIGLKKTSEVQPVGACASILVTRQGQLKEMVSLTTA